MLCSTFILPKELSERCKPPVTFASLVSKRSSESLLHKGETLTEMMLLVGERRCALIRNHCGQPDIPDFNRKSKREIFTISPAHPNYEGNIVHQMLRLRNTISYSNEDLVAFLKIAVDVENVMRIGWPGC
ncbi:unnamed protein product [Colias eurytheme]|nr:unnamed protein product [Colias eurytheme]